MKQSQKRRVCVYTMHHSKDLRILNRQCQSLHKNGWDVTLIATSEITSCDYVDNGIAVMVMPKWKSGWDRLKHIFKITYKAYKQKADVYHFHDPDLLVPSVLLRILTFKPVIYDIHEFFYRNQVEKLPKIWILRKIISALIWCMETVCGVIIGRISAVYEDHIKRFSKLGCKTVHTPNYASIDDFNPRPISDIEWQGRRKRVLFTGTLAPERGSLMLLDIAKRLKEIRGDIEFCVSRRFLSQYQEKIFMEKMALPGYRDVIKFVPNVTGAELPQIVRCGGIGLSTVLNMGQGNCIVPTRFFEYMSQALSIVASNLPASVKYVANENCGILVEPDDVEGYVQAIIKLVDNPELAKQMGENGQKAFIEKYNWGVVEKRLVEFYESIPR